MLFFVLYLMLLVGVKIECLENLGFSKLCFPYVASVIHQLKIVGLPVAHSLQYAVVCFAVEEGQCGFFLDVRIECPQLAYGKAVLVMRQVEYAYCGCSVCPCVLVQG